MKQMKIEGSVLSPERHCPAAVLSHAVTLSLPNSVRTRRMACLVRLFERLLCSRTSSLRMFRDEAGEKGKQI